jgi:hypothetical protein
MYSEEEDDTPFVQNDKTSDQVIFEFGAPQDFDGKCCSPMYNCWSMCFNTKIPSQMELYNRLTIKVE